MNSDIKLAYILSKYDNYTIQFYIFYYKTIINCWLLSYLIQNQGW